MDAASSAWNKTKEKTQKALERPKKLLDLLSGRRRDEMDDEYGDEEGEGAVHRRLMNYACAFFLSLCVCV